MRSVAVTKHTSAVFLYLAFVLVASFFTYFYRYDQPSAVYWDEPYHIASAQKYLHHVYFMEPHPPFGKLLIALGEKMLHANARSDQFIDTDYATGIPDTFSFAGYRLFPALLAWLTAPVLFLIFLLLTKHPAHSTLFSFLYIFDNALIAHNRGAMIDSPLIFFSMVSVLLFLLLLQKRRSSFAFLSLALLFGICFGIVMTTKVVGLILILLIPALLFALYPSRKKILSLLFFFSLGFLLAFVTVWQIHFSLATTVNPKLNSDGYYQASQAYKTALITKQTSSLQLFPVMIRDSFNFVTHYNKGVPALDICKADENGSPFFFWPFGAKSINYRWASAGTDTYRYIYLQVNPVVWLCGLFGLVMTAVLLLATLFLPLKKKPEHLFLLCTFSALYVGYMIAISRITRVMYLYHYFLPFLFSLILFVLVTDSLRFIGKWKLDEQRRSFIFTCMAILVFASFQFYRPLSYYEPITNAQMAWRSIFSLWDLHCVTCPHTNVLGIATK